MYRFPSGQCNCSLAIVAAFRKSSKLLLFCCLIVHHLNCNVSSITYIVLLYESFGKSGSNLLCHILCGHTLKHLTAIKWHAHRIKN